MSFYFGDRGDDYKSLKGLINRNEGKFTSEAQGRFWRNRFFQNIKLLDKQHKDEADFDVWSQVNRYMGQQAPEGTHTVNVDAYVSFGRTVNEIVYTFVLDAEGVLAMYKTVKKGTNEVWITNRAVSSLKTFKENQDQIELDAAKAWGDEMAAKGLTIPNGERITVKGTVEHVYMRDSEYGLNMKMRVRSEHGYVLYGAVPKAFRNFSEKYGLNPMEGMFTDTEISFEALVTVNKNMVFFSRPTKFEMAEEYIAYALLKKEY